MNSHTSVFFGFGVVEGLGVADALAEGATEALAEADGLIEGDAEGEALGVADALALGEGDTLGLADGEALAEADGLGESDGVAEGDTLGDADGEAEALAEGLGPATGSSAEDEEFCGAEASLVIKSPTLLSVSSPFPAVASAPVVILSAVDPELAFLSTLPLASGAVSPAPSVNPLETVPNPTASTSVPTSTAPSLKAMLLLLDKVWPVARSHARETSSASLHQRKKPCAGITSPSLNATTEVSADPVAVLLTNLKSPRSTAESLGL